MMALATAFTFSSHTVSPSSRSTQYLQHFFKPSQSKSSSAQNFYHCKCSHGNSSLSAVSFTTLPVKTLSDIQNSGIIACLRAQSSELALEAARAAINGGITVLEIVMSTPGVLEVLQQLALEYPRTAIGAGTVLQLQDAKDAIKSGAKFLLSPAMVKDILDYVSGSEALYIPGAMTPTEILSAFNEGVKMVKVYPISAMGGIKYIAALKKPFPHIPMVASQGITIDSIEEYLAHGATSVVLSDAIFHKQAMDERDFQLIYELSHQAVLRANKAMERKRRRHH